MNKTQIKKKLLELIHAKTGWGDPLQPGCEFEELTNLKITEKPDGTLEITFKYLFDEDGFSQYSKEHQFKGTLKIDDKENLIEFVLLETYVGEAANYEYKPK